MIGWVQQCMWEEWHASDVTQHRAHPAQRWLGSRWHRPIAAVVWGSRVGRSPGKGLVAPSLKEWVNPVCRYAQFRWLHIGVVCWLPFEVNVQAGGRNGSWPTVLNSFLPINVLHDKTFPYAKSQEGRGRERRCLERCRDICESTCHDTGCDFTSHATVNSILRKCHTGVV